MKGGEKMKKLGKKLRFMKETIEAYCQCWCANCDCAECNCWASPAWSADYASTNAYDTSSSRTSDLSWALLHDPG